MCTRVIQAFHGHVTKAVGLEAMYRNPRRGTQTQTQGCSITDGEMIVLGENGVVRYLEETHGAT